MAFDDSQYSVWPVIFAEEDSGTTQMSYAVQLDTSDNSSQRYSLWRSGVSPYIMYPDPALNLPGKWSTTKGDMSQFAQFVSNDVDTATRIRGLSIIDSEGNNAGRLVSPGETYTIQVPISNYSLTSPPTGIPVEVAFQYNRGYSGITLTPKTKIGRVDITDLKAWDGVNDTRQIVEYTWKVPTAAENPDFKNGSHLRLYVEIDPDDTLQEVHEAWTDVDPAGNNVGYAEFSVGSADIFSTISVNGKKIQAAPVSEIKAAAVKSADFSVSLTNVTKDDIRAAIKKGDPILVEGSVTYTGAKPIANFEVTVEEAPKAGEPTHLLAAKIIPLIMPGESRKFSFMLRPWELEGEELFVYVKSDGTGRVLISGGKIDDGGGDDGAYGSGGGCDAFGGAIALVLASGAAMVLRKKK
jgi:uncharacterized protein YbdZ (MbtH family)